MENHMQQKLEQDIWSWGDVEARLLTDQVPLLPPVLCCNIPLEHIPAESAPSLHTKRKAPNRAKDRGKSRARPSSPAKGCAQLGPQGTSSLGFVSRWRCGEKITNEEEGRSRLLRSLRGLPGHGHGLQRFRQKRDRAAYHARKNRTRTRKVNCLQDPPNTLFSTTPQY